MAALLRNDSCHCRRAASSPLEKTRRPEHEDVTYPAGLSVGKSGGEERLLVASHGSDEALLLNTSNGKIIHRFDLSTFRRIPPRCPTPQS